MSEKRFPFDCKGCKYFRTCADMSVDDRCLSCYLLGESVYEGDVWMFQPIKCPCETESGEQRNE